MSELFYVPADGPPESVSVRTGSHSDYSHRFGGEIRHKGATFAGCDRPLTLLYTFDLADPSVRPKIPGVRFLPLFNGLRFDSSPVYYGIKSDDEIEILRQDRTKFTPSFPYTNYPDTFPELSVSLGPAEPIHYDQDVRDTWQSWAWPDKQPRDPDKNEVIQCHDLIYNGGIHECVNPNCRLSNVNYLAAFHDEWLHDQGVSIWGGYEDVVIVYYLCYSCFTVSAFNLVN
jgi:hypothetical protein